MFKQQQNTAADLGLLALRATVGGLMAGHGAQKLFGSFGGHGLEGTAGWLESIGMTPGTPWALLAGASEFGSGMLIALGLFGPIGPITAYGPMIIAWRTVHAGKPIWITSGGGELPLINLAVATALALTGPGHFSLDRALNIKVPKPLVALATVGVAAGVAAGLLMRKQAAPAEQKAAQPAAADDDQVEPGQAETDNT